MLGGLFFGMASVSAQDGLLVPVPDDTAKTPSISVVSPQKDSIVSSKFTLEMEVSNYLLTAKPVEEYQAGVIAVYVDGKFFTNTASTSATLTIPRVGTHYVEVELTHVDRSPFVPRIADSFTIHVQKKSPLLQVLDFRPDSTVYTATPTFPILYEYASFEENSGYYQVFVDGEVDGTSKDLADPTRYTLNTPLTEGKHSLRVALYNANDRPVVPTVDFQVPFIYSQNKPVIENVTLPRNTEMNKEVPFEVVLSGFTPGKDGYIDVFAEGVHYYVTEPQSRLPRLSGGNQKVTFTLLDKNGFVLKPSVSVEKIVSVQAQKTESGPSALIPGGIFTTAEDGQQPRWGFLILGAIEAVAIVVFGVLLLRHERKK